MRFYSIEIRILSLIFSSNFFCEVLILGVQKSLYIVPNLMSNYSVHADLIPYELIHLQLQNHHCSRRLILHRNTVFWKKVIQRKLAVGFQLNVRLTYNCSYTRILYFFISFSCYFLTFPLNKKHCDLIDLWALSKSWIYQLAIYCMFL